MSVALLTITTWHSAPPLFEVTAARRQLRTALLVHPAPTVGPTDRCRRTRRPHRPTERAAEVRAGVGGRVGQFEVRLFRTRCLLGSSAYLPRFVKLSRGRLSITLSGAISFSAMRGMTVRGQRRSCTISSKPSG